MKQEETSSQEQVTAWEREITQHVMEINRVKMEVQEPDQRKRLLAEYVDASVACAENITRVMGQNYALRVLCEAYLKMRRD
jgi:hypothetical protein